MKLWREMDHQERTAAWSQCAVERAAERQALEARRGEGERARAERERFWLAQERAPLNGRRGRPLSRQPA